MTTLLRKARSKHMCEVPFGPADKSIRRMLLEKVFLLELEKRLCGPDNVPNPIAPEASFDTGPVEAASSTLSDSVFLASSTERLSNAAMSRSSVPTEATGFNLDSVCLRQSDAIDWTADGFAPNTDEHDYSALNSLCNISQAAWNTPLQGYTSFLYDETTVNAGWPDAHVPVACHSQAFTTESQQYENEGEADSRYRRYDGW